MCSVTSEASLKVYLHGITGCQSTEIPDDEFMAAIEASYDPSLRKDLMRHLRDCLTESSGKRWARILGALDLLEKMLQFGDPTLVVESAHGRHFDVLQKVSLLEHFDATTRGIEDDSAQSLIRGKAQQMRVLLVQLLEQADVEEYGQKKREEEEPPVITKPFPCKDVGALSACKEALSRETMSCSSPGGASTCTGATWSSNASSSSFGGGASPASTTRQFQGLRSSLSLDTLRSASGLSLAESLEADARLSPLGRLTRHLNNIIDSGLTDFPPELFTHVVRASHDIDDLMTILAHLQRRCLGDLENTPWQRILAGLTLVEHLMHRGSPDLFSEQIASDIDFCLSRQIWNLQWVEFQRNWKVHNLVRRKTTQIWNNMCLQAQDKETIVQDEKLDFARLNAWVEADDWSSSRTSDVDSLSDSGTWIDLTGEDCAEDSDCESVHSCFSEERDFDLEASEAFYTPASSPLPPLPKLPAPHAIPSW